MTIGVVATITIAEGSNAEFEQAFLVLAEQVRARPEYRECVMA